MSGSLNMTLDEIVKRSKSARSAGKGNSRRGRGPSGFVGGGKGTGPARRGPLGVTVRPSSFSINKPARRMRTMPWQTDLFEESLKAAGVSGVEIGATVHVSNLDQGVTNEDIRELFAEIGELKRYAIHYDNSGRPSGSAEVVYMRRSDAFQALKKYNNVLLDGRSMNLEIVGGKPEVPVAARVNVTGLNGRIKRTVFLEQRVRGGRGRGGRVRGAAPQRLQIGSQNQQGGGMRGGRGGFRGRGRGAGGRGSNKSGRGGKKPVEKSAEELDKDLESYHAEAMNIS